MGLTVRIEPALDDLDPVEVAAVGVLHRRDQEARRLADRCARQVAAHRHTLGIAGGGRQPCLGVGLVEVPPTEEANSHPGAGRGVCLLALHGVEDRLARVLRRPYRGPAPGRLLPAVDGELRVRSFDNHVLPTMRPRLHSGVLAEEVLLFGARHRCVAVGRADHSDLEGIDSQTLLHRHAVLQRLAHVLVLQHVLRLGLGTVEVRPIPGLVIGELVVRRQERVGLAIALDLSDLVDRLEARAQLGQLTGVGLAVVGLDGEHAPVAQVAVVGDRQHLGSGAIRELRQMAPQILRVLTVELREGHGLIGDRCVAAEQDVPVQIVPTASGVLVTDDGGESPGLVEPIGQGRVLPPGIPHRRRIVDRGDLLAERGDDLHRRAESQIGIASVQLVVPAPTDLGPEDRRIAIPELRHQAVHLRVIRDDDEVERSRQLGLEPVGRGDLLAPSEAEGIFLPHGVHRARVDGDGGVEMCLAEVHFGRELSSDVGREGRLGSHNVARLGTHVLCPGDRGHQGAERYDRSQDSSYVLAHALASPWCKLATTRPLFA